MSELTIEVSGLNPAERKLLQLGTLLADLRPFWPLVSTMFIGWESRMFETEGAFGGSAWAELSHDYAVWKSAHYPGKPILSATGALRKAATSPKRVATARTLELAIEPYEGGRSRTIGRTTLSLGGAFGGRAAAASSSSKTMQPSWFQKGTETMPPRPLIFETLPPEAVGEAVALGETYARGLIERLRLRP